MLTIDSATSLITDYVKPELLVVAIVLYFVGIALKNSATVKDEFIPMVLGAIGVVLAMIYVFATTDISGAKELANAAFVSITQGILCAAGSVYVSQIMIQKNKKSSSDTTE